MNAFIVMMFSLLLTVGASAEEWAIQPDIDEMTNEVVGGVAFSPIFKIKSNLDLEGSILFSCKKNEPMSATISFSKRLFFTGPGLGSSITSVNLRVRFDEGIVKNVNFLAAPLGSSFIRFEQPWAIYSEEFNESSILKVEVKYHGGPAFFIEAPLAGAKDAALAVLEYCPAQLQKKSN